MFRRLTLYLSSAAESRIATESKQTFPLESGGVLLGYWSGFDVVVTKASGPGPKAEHGTTSFAPDHDYQVRWIAKAFAESGGTETYLGDWHSHPNGRPRPSPLDRELLRSIAGYKEARAPRPIMLIAAVDTAHLEIAGYCLWRSVRRCQLFSAR